MKDTLLCKPECCLPLRARCFERLMRLPEHRKGFQKVTRREFLKGSAAIAASIAASSSAQAATEASNDSQFETSLFLPPLLTCPTETSIRISALNNKRPAEAVIELRKDGLPDWER